MNSVATAALQVVVPLAATASDRLVRRRTLVLGTFLAMAAVAIPLFALMHGCGWAELLVAQTTFGLLIAVPLGAAPALFAEMLHAEDRETGHSLAYNVGLGVVGGTAPLAATGLIDLSGSALAPAAHLTAAALVASDALATVTDRSREPLHGRSGVPEPPRSTSSRQRRQPVRSAGSRVP